MLAAKLQPLFEQEAKQRMLAGKADPANLQGGAGAQGVFASHHHVDVMPAE
jgi:hypothetical protein